MSRENPDGSVNSRPPMPQGSPPRQPPPLQQQIQPYNGPSLQQPPAVIIISQDPGRRNLNAIHAQLWMQQREVSSYHSEGSSSCMHSKISGDFQRNISPRIEGKDRRNDGWEIFQPGPDNDGWS